MFSSFKLSIDWILLGVVVLISAAGLVTIYSFTGENSFYERQAVWLTVSLALCFALSFFDFRFLRRTGAVVTIFLLCLLPLIALFIFGNTIKGARSWFDFGLFSFQPTDPAKIALIILLAKYFSRRHIEIGNIRHILISGLYAFILFLVVFFQPDFGSAIIIVCIWFGMVLVSGISKKHLLAVLAIGILSAGALWFFVFEEYQKARIANFIHPLADVRGTGYNAYQATIAVGSGGLLGKGIGYGTQSRLAFLPEYETDFVFAAFAEEWGFVGVVLFFGLYAVLLWRILHIAFRGASNFETLFGVGLAVMLMSHFLIHVGMNLGLLPITGTPLPFMSYGGSHLLTEFMGLGIIMAMRRYSRPAGRVVGIMEQGNLK